MFGYSVLLHETGGSKMAIIGAPRANTTQPLKQPGAVYRCNISFGEIKKYSNCTSWIREFDSEGDVNVTVSDGYGERITKIRETKSDQYFGISLQRTKDWIISCAHLYKDHYKGKIYRADKKLPIGRCIVLSHDLKTKHGAISPCLDVSSSHDTYGACLAGASITADKNKIVVGAPNSNYAIGNAFYVTSMSRNATEMKVTSLTRSRNEVEYAG